MSTLQQYDLIAAPTKAGYPYFAVVQSDLLGGLVTRIVAPLVDATKLDPLESLWPKVAFNNSTYVVLIPLMQSLRLDPSMIAIGNVGANADAIQSSIALAFTPPS